jgi:uncharacterized protein
MPAARYKEIEVNWLMAEPSVTHRPDQGSSSGTFELEGDGKRLGYLEYSLPDADTVRIDYVEVDRALRGKRMGNRLVDAAVEWARSNKHQVIARCSFARAVLNRTPKYSDVLKSPQITR